MEKIVPKYERLWFGSLLTMIAGSVDAYSYLLHGGVFAGLQTGNLILLGLSVGQGQWGRAIQYLISISAFLLGVLLVRSFQKQFKLNKTNQQQIMVLQFQFCLLILVAWFGPGLSNAVATALLSISAASELQEFRRLKNGSFTPLMMTGNLRTLAENMYDGIVLQDIKARTTAFETSLLISSFAGGALLMGGGLPILGQWVLALPIALIGCAIWWLKIK